MFSIMQLALVYVAKQVVTYASFSAARAAVVAEGDTPEALQEDAYARASRAAALICAPITGETIAGANVAAADMQAATIQVPGWGRLAKSGISGALKTHVSALEFTPDGEVSVTVTHYYEMTFPVVNYIFAWMYSDRAPASQDAFGASGTDVQGDEGVFEQTVGIWKIDAPHMRLRETTRLVVP